MNRHERRAQGRTLPAGKRAFPMLPPEIKSMVSGMADNIRGLPWYSAWAVANDLGEMIQAKARGRGDDEMAAAQAEWERAMAALIECLNGTPDKCEEVFQAALYRLSARKDHNKAAERYEKKLGGPEACQAEMERWAREHEDEIEALDSGVAVTNYEGNGPLDPRTMHPAEAAALGLPNTASDHMPILTDAEASEITAECVAAIDVQIELMNANPDRDAVTGDDLLAAITPHQPATLRVLDWLKSAGRELMMTENKSGIRRVVLLPTTIHPIADVLRDQGFDDEVRRIMDALERSDAAAQPN